MTQARWPAGSPIGIPPCSAGALLDEHQKPSAVSTLDIPKLLQIIRIESRELLELDFFDLEVLDEVSEDALHFGGAGSNCPSLGSARFLCSCLLRHLRCLVGRGSGRDNMKVALWEKGGKMKR